MITITRAILREWGACYSDECIAKHVPVEGLTPLQVLDLDIPPADRFWVVLREDFLTPQVLRELACDFATLALDIIPPKQVDPRSRDAVAVARRFARGEATRGEMDAAAAAAYAARAAWDQMIGLVRAALVEEK